MAGNNLECGNCDVPDLRYKITKNADWKNFADVRESWKNADVAGRFVVIDISNNRCRPITTIKSK
jgi:mRNA-degrading endonuclease HigB of HigAB toxin-antitoxin module